MPLLYIACIYVAKCDCRFHVHGHCNLKKLRVGVFERDLKREREREKSRDAEV